MKILSVLTKGEMIFRYLACLLLVVLAVIQVFFLKDATRMYLSYIDRLEGQSVSINLPLSPVKTLAINETSETPTATPLKTLRESRIIVIRMIQPRMTGAIYAMVNGQYAGDFKTGDLKLTVFNGDYVEIDSSAFPDAAQFVIRVPGSGLTFPEDGLVVDTNGSQTAIGKIKFK